MIVIIIMKTTMRIQVPLLLFWVGPGTVWLFASREWVVSWNVSLVVSKIHCMYLFETQWKYFWLFFCKQGMRDIMYCGTTSSAMQCNFFFVKHNKIAVQQCTLYRLLQSAAEYTSGSKASPHSAIWWYKVQRSAISMQCNAVQCSAVQCSV